MTLIVAAKAKCRPHARGSYISRADCVWLPYHVTSATWVQPAPTSTRSKALLVCKASFVIESSMHATAWIFVNSMCTFPSKGIHCISISRDTESRLLKILAVVFLTAFNLRITFFVHCLQNWNLRQTFIKRKTTIPKMSSEKNENVLCRKKLSFGSIFFQA